MTEFTTGIYEAGRDIYKKNRGSILRTVVYTIGHFAIAIIVLMSVADVPFAVALTDAIVEPLANSVWYFMLDKFWASKSGRKP
tara:strand:- start:946 stop:1194 length:249 start_codon:yes stop_codon:yes gene_type:complete